MRFFASPKVRIFCVCWIVFSAHFATNVVREHYPAFALIDHGDFRLDEYAGFHSDIFVHTDGHAYIGNQVAGALPAVPALLVFDPVLDALEERSRKKLREAGGEVEVRYETEYPNRQAFYRLVKERGLDLRFGAATAITSVFCMAPLCAFFVASLFGMLRRRGVAERRAVGLAFLLAFGTPIFYRAAHLNHNVFLMMAAWWSFRMVWPDRGEEACLPVARRLAGGFLAGWMIALDYAGVVPLFVIYGYLLATRWRAVGPVKSFTESLAFVIGSVPPVAFLIFTQWWMYGDPILPGQYHMPAVNFTDEGWRGFAMPSFDVFWQNLFSLNWGLYTFGPLLILGLVPSRLLAGKLLFPRRERIAAGAFILAFMLFCAGNRYSLMQFNTGFRYLLPLVPFIFMQLADVLVRLPARVLAVIGTVAVVHEWVLCMVRYTKIDFRVGPAAVPECWRRVLTEGLQLPWLTRLQQISPDDSVIASAWVPYAVIAAVIASCLAVWRLGRRSSETQRSSSAPRG